MKSNDNPYKKTYKTTKITKTTKTTNTFKIDNYKCNKCKVIYNNPIALEKHNHIHINPIYCPFTKCGKTFLPKHTYQYKQHIDSHNGGLHIKCKFCAIYSKSLSANTLHIKKYHSDHYTYYRNEIDKANQDIQPLNTKKFINLTTNYDDEDEDDEWISIELNKNNVYYYSTNLDLLSTIALLDAYKKI